MLTDFSHLFQPLFIVYIQIYIHDKQQDQRSNNMGTLTKSEISALLRNRDCEIAQMINKYNNIIKCISTTSEPQYYVWCRDSKLYIQNDSNNNNLKLAIINILQHIINRVSKAKRLPKQTITKMFDIFSRDYRIANIMLVLDIKPEQRFKELLDKHPYFFAIKHGKKIDIRTKYVTSRTIHDYFTTQVDHTYVRDLHPGNNVFVQFIKTLFPDDVEYKFIQYLFGYLLSLKITENIFVVFSNPKGGGGKTLLMNTLHQIFSCFITKLSKNSVLHGIGNVNAELCKLKNRRIAYIDEALDHETTQNNVKHKSLVLDTLLDITGGGIRQDRDNYNKGIDTNMQTLNAKLILLGNNNSINNETHFALNRRIVYIPMQYYFRHKNHGDYKTADPYCLEADPTIKSTLENNLDHAFTWTIDCMHLYFYGKPEILKIIPDRFTQAWNMSVAVNPKHEYWKEFVQNNIIQTLGEVETLTDVRLAINNSIINASIECYTNKHIIHELRQQSTMKLLHSHRGKKGKYILNCTLKRNNSILNNWNKQSFIYRIR